MEEIKNDKPCCDAGNTDASCTCSSNEGDSGKSAKAKKLNLIICSVVLLAVVSIVVYKVIATGNNKNADAPAFDFGQVVSTPAPYEGNAEKAGLNLGEYLESLDELNTVAIDTDAVIVFIPASGNVLIDDATKATIIKFQQDLKNSNITVGLYTLSCDSPDYAEIESFSELPTIYVARKGASAIVIDGSNVDEYMLMEAYQSCCDASSGCC